MNRVVFGPEGQSFYLYNGNLYTAKTTYQHWICPRRLWKEPNQWWVCDGVSMVRNVSQLSEKQRSYIGRQASCYRKYSQHTHHNPPNITDTWSHMWIQNIMIVTSHERHSAWNHWKLGCLFNRLSRPTTTTKTPQFCITGSLWENPPGHGFPSQRAINTKSVSTNDVMILTNAIPWPLCAVRITVLY